MVYGRDSIRDGDSDLDIQAELQRFNTRDMYVNNHERLYIHAIINSIKYDHRCADRTNRDTFG